MKEFKGEKRSLEYLRVPFEPHQIGKLPKPTAKQTEEAKAPKWNGIKCKVCGTWHHKDVIHLDYVGHAALTDRFLDVDPEWRWEPLAFKEGLPVFDDTGGLWIALTILGVTRIGYGNAAESKYKDVGSREKEVIGDALRNAGMRFGCALDLWHKGDLHLDDDEPGKPKQKKKKEPLEMEGELATRITKFFNELRGTDEEIESMIKGWKSYLNGFTFSKKEIKDNIKKHFKSREELYKKGDER